MLSSSSEDISFSSSDSGSSMSISNLYLSLDLKGDTADSLLNRIMVKNLTPSELRGAPIGCKLPPLTPKNTRALLNAQVKAASNITIVEHNQQQQYKFAASTLLGTKTRAPISSGFEHTPAKRRRFPPIPEAECNLSSDSDIEILPLSSSSQTNSSPHPSVTTEILSTPESKPKLSPGQLSFKKMHAQIKRRAEVHRCFKRLQSLIPHIRRFRKRKTLSHRGRMLRACGNYVTFLANKYGVLKERFDKLKMEKRMLCAEVTDYSFNLRNQGPVIPIEDMPKLYEQHVRSRAQNNWKFWMLGFFMEPLLISYNSIVSCKSVSALRCTSLTWLLKNYTFVSLISDVTDKIAYLSGKTDLLSDPPTTLQEEVCRALNNEKEQHPHLYGALC